MHDMPIPTELPEVWRSRWSGVMNGAPPAAFHDAPLPNADAEKRLEIERRNRRMAERLLEEVKPYWF
jgi:hypothetical protein